MTQSREVSIVADARGLVESPRWRVWAQLEGPPDGICIDQEGAIWYADVPNSYCRRVKEGAKCWMRCVSTAEHFPARWEDLRDRP